MILDTDALSATADNDSGIAAFLARADLVAIPVIVLGEYRYGIAQSRRRGTTMKGGCKDSSMTAWCWTSTSRPPIFAQRSTSN
jgi:hypothetical protein